MAMPRRIKIEFGQAFPYGVFAVSPVTPLRDFDKSSRDREVQAVDEESGMPVWTIDVLDADPAARRSERQFSVRITAPVQPVVPAAIADLPFRPIEFEGLTATPYVADSGGRGRVAWSMRASGMRAPGPAPRGRQSGQDGAS